MEARLTDKPIRVGFEIELMVTPNMPQLRGLGHLEDDNKISTPRYFHTVLPIQGDNYEPDPRFLNVVKRILQLADLPLENVSVPGGRPNQYRGWSVHGDPSLTPVSPEAVGFELSSPAFDARSLIWEEQTTRAFGQVDNHFKIITSTSCGTHVHVKPEQGDWELNAIKKLAKAIVVFGPIISQLLGPARQISVYCKDNTQGRYVHRDLTSRGGLALVLRQIQSKKKTTTLVNYMCPPEPGDELGRNYVWNLTNVSDANSCGTVEFRGAEMSEAMDDVRKWVAFVIGFEGGANLATNEFFKQYTTTDPTRDDLLDFVEGGLLPEARLSIRDWFSSGSQGGGGSQGDGGSPGGSQGDGD